VELEAVLKPTTKQAYKLFHDGCLALAQVEANGMRIDTQRLDKTIEQTGRRIKRLEEELKTDTVWSTWRKRFGERSSLGSRQQLGVILFQVLKYKSKAETKKKRVQVNEAALERIKLLFVKRYLRLEKLKKLQGTYLKGIRREVVDGLLRPSYNLHFVTSYRSSADTPNLQNIPIRDDDIGKLVRSCFVARDNHRLVEVDFSALEFRIAASFWRDDAMVKYASDPNLDIHRDMAAECYCLPVDEVPKNVRFFAKNQFVFPELYGSYYVSCAKNLWNVIRSGDLKTKEGKPLNEHLADQGIEHESFEEHIQEVEERFNERFPTWSDRKEKWQQQYRKRGWFPLMTGFRCSGVYSRNQLMNIPIQGPAFHCLLYSLIKLNAEMVKKKMRSVIIGEIHDSILSDVHEDEFVEYVGMARRIMTEDVRKAWPWIITPLSVDVEASPVGGSWYEKKGVVV